MPQVNRTGLGFFFAPKLNTMGKDFAVPFAYDHAGNMIEPDQAYKKTDYKCNCGSVVRLRGGDKVTNHFYHVTEANCSLESVIHKAYKEVFKREKKIKLPYPIDGVQVLEFDRVELEKKVGDFIPDAIGYIGDTMHLIEFAKTSFIGERKKAKIKKANLLCVEIAIYLENRTVEGIAKHLCTESYATQIVHIPMYSEMKQLREKFAEAYTKIKCERDYLQNELKKALSKPSIKPDPLEIPLFFKWHCKNGADLYTGEYRSKYIYTAFVKSKKVLNLFIAEKLDKSMEPVGGYLDKIEIMKMQEWSYAAAIKKARILADPDNFE